MQDRDEVIKLGVLLELFELAERDASFIARLVDSFVARANDLTKICRRALDENDAESVEAVAHEIRSSGAQLGALRLPAIARELENLARSGSDGLRPLGERFLAEVEVTCKALVTQLQVIRAIPE